MTSCLSLVVRMSNGLGADDAAAAFDLRAPPTLVATFFTIGKMFRSAREGQGWAAVSNALAAVAAPSAEQLGAAAAAPRAHSRARACSRAGTRQKNDALKIEPKSGVTV